MIRKLLPIALVGSLALSGCSLFSGSDEPTNGATGPESSSGSPSGAPGNPTTLRVLAGSEVRDMEPILAEAAKATGVTVKLSYAGTLDGAEQVAGGKVANDYDATWFSSNRYLDLIPGGRQAVTRPTKIMTSPVILGLRPGAAKRLGWDTKAPTWAEISQAAQTGKFTYGMTNPASSNSGFSALVGVATALAGGGAALDAKRIEAVKPKLTQFFSGQKLTSGSSGWLADRFRSGADGVDGLINYESVLLGLDVNGEKLTPIYPRDGVVSGEYPLSLLASASDKGDAFTRLTDWLRTPDAQKLIMERTHRRPVVPGVKLAPEFGKGVLIELPFPNQRAAADGLIASYLNEVRRPSQTIYVVDTSGSMAGERLAQLKKAFATLTGKDHGADAFLTFNRRERVTVIPFSSDAQAPTTFDIPEKDAQPTLDKIDKSVDDLQAYGGTALYTALRRGYEVAGQQVAADPNTFTSIVLMTDGEKTAGIDAQEMLTAYKALPDDVRKVPTFAVMFGESSSAELDEIAKTTGGKVFDARTASLAQVFKEIRGYQ